MKADEVSAAGNTFGLAFIVAFAFVYFAIIDPHYSRDLAPERHIQMTLQQVEITEAHLQEKLSRLRDRSSDDRWRFGPPPLQAKPSTSRKQRGAIFQPDSNIDPESVVREKLVQLGVAHQSLSKAKADKKDYAIPFMSVSMNEDTLLKFFPILVLIGLIRLLIYRANLLRILPATSESFLPVWTAPLPYGANRLSFRRWIGLNFLGFAAVGSIIFLLLRFVILYARENRSSLILAVEEVTLIALWILMYFFIIGSAMLQKPSDTEQVEEEDIR